MMKSKLYSLFTALFLVLLITLPRIDASAAGGKWNLRDGNWYYTEADGTDHTGWLLDGEAANQELLKRCHADRLAAAGKQSLLYAAGRRHADRLVQSERHMVLRGWERLH